jgi:hypothetical protein
MTPAFQNYSSQNHRDPNPEISVILENILEKSKHVCHPKPTAHDWEVPSTILPSGKR